MGWNTGFKVFEQTVIGAYDLGKLDDDGSVVIGGCCIAYDAIRLIAKKAESKRKA